MDNYFEQYIDTDLTGLIVTIQHNLGTVPVLGFTRIVDNKEILVSVDDPIFTSSEVLSSSEIKVTFSDSFKGYCRAVVGTVADIQTRIDELENNINLLYQQIGLRATIKQLTQLTSLRDQQLEDVNKRITSLATKLDTLTVRVDSL